MSSSTPPVSASPFSVATPVGDFVVARPGTARQFERAGIDYCCGGRRPLATVCRERGLDPAAFLAALLQTGAAGTDAGPDPATLSLTALADHIERTHHEYVKAELPRLVEMADRVARKHGWRDGRLKEIAQTVTVLADEMFSHMAKEERILFPVVRAIESGATAALSCGGSIAAPIRQMEAEHDFAGRAVARLRELTDGFRPDENACNTHRALLGGLEEFEGDLHRHVHKENNILFPRALAHAGAA